MVKIITAEQAVALMQDEVTIAAAGCGLSGWAEEIAQAMGAVYKATGHPKNINWIQGCAIGDWNIRKTIERGTSSFAIEGLIKCWTGAHIGSSSGMCKLLNDNKMEAYCLPQGVIVQRWREIAAHRPGLVTKIGLHTFVDPRVEGGKMNDVTTKDIVKVVQFEGEEYLFYESFPVDVALIRGTTADENGNISMEKEGVLVEALPLAQAAHNTGGIVIAQVERLAEAGTLHPKNVKVPGVLVDYIVVATKEESCWQAEGTYFNPSFSGDIRTPLHAIKPLPLDIRKIMGRRAALELQTGSVINLGVGMPTTIATIAAEENVSNLLTMTTEIGTIGGVPSGLPDFGQAWNAEAMVEEPAQFDFYAGGGLTATFLGLAQTDEQGNVNVSKFSGRPMGCGGFVDISQGTKNVIYIGSFTAKGLNVEVKDGQLRILQEGMQKKFLKQVEQISFSGEFAMQAKQNVLYVTERAVFRLIEGKMTLIEIAPGIDLEKDILQQMEFLPTISKNLKYMPEEIFYPVWGRLQAMMKQNN